MTSLKHFIKGVQTVLPKLDLMGDVLEACGFQCQVNRCTKYGQIGCEWMQGEMRMELELMLGDSDEIAWLQLWDKNNDNSSVQAMHDDGAANWCVIFSDSVHSDSPLTKLEADIRTFLGDDGHDDCVELHDETTVREIVNMFATLFKRQG